MYSSLVEGVSVLGVHRTKAHSISNDTLKTDVALITSANKGIKEKFIHFSEVPTHVILMNDFSEILTVMLC